MPRYYCDYCDTYLTHDSPSVRKQHNAGYKHKANVRTYYQQFEEQQTQSLIDQRIKEHLGQAAAFQQVGSTFHQHLVSLPGMPQRPRLPVLPPPMMPIGGTSQASSQLVPSMRPPVPMPLSAAPGYMAPPMPSAVGPPGASSLPLPVTIPPSSSTAPSNGAISMAPPAMYQTSQTATSGSYEAFNPSIGSMQRGSSNAPTDGYSYASADSNH